MRELVIFLEERSAKEMLEGFLPRVLPASLHVRYVVFDGKSDLEKQLARKLRGWLAPETGFVVLRDQDAEDCRRLKRRLTDICRESGRPETVVRIACRELESWYFGDLDAVEQALESNNLRRFENKASYRSPDTIVNPARELERITEHAYRKVAGSRAIGRHLKTDPSCNRSVSFGHFLRSLTTLTTHAS